MDFTYKAYENLILMLKEKGYIFCDFSTYKSYNRCCIMRHDVDFDLHKAASFSKFEKSMPEGGIHSTYMILVSSDFYNICSKRSIKAIKDILVSGHDIGLHFDETKYEIENQEDLKEKIQEECRLLSSIISRPVKVISMHRPSRKVLDADLQIDGIINTYSQLFFKDFKYLSDSRMEWRENVVDIVKEGFYNRLQILTHPIWYGDEIKGIKQCILEQLEMAVPQKYIYISENITALENIISVDEIPGIVDFLERETLLL